MKLLHLAFAGIGPFLAEQHVDFTAFEDSGLFLMRGPTGAGKSTVIDAIVYALYGTVARGSDSSKDRLRSTWCEPHDASWVELVFEVPSGIHRVRRTPGYTRPGRATPINPTVHVELVEMGADGEYHQVRALSRGIREAQDVLTHAVGLSADQFLQTVVLPQGRFADFLTATSAEREEILRDVFGTRTFVAIEEALRQGARTRSGSVERARSDVEAALASWGRAAARHLDPNGEAPGIDTPSAPVAVEDEEDFLAPLDAVCGSARERHEEDLRAQEVARRALMGARAAHEAGEDLSERRAEAARLLLEKEGITALAEADATESARLDRAALAGRLAPDWRRLHDARRVLADRASELSLLIADLDEADAPWGTDLLPLLDADTDPNAPTSTADGPDITASGEELVCADVSDALRHRIHALSERAVQMHELLELESGLPAREDALADLASRLDSLGRSLAAIDEREERLPADIAALDAILAKENAVRDSLDGLLAEQRELAERLDAARRASTMTADLVKRSEDLRTAVEEARIAALVEMDARQRWQADAAVTLAEGLEDGVACPVCGSLDHPHPAADADAGENTDHVTLEALHALGDATRAAEVRLEAARGEHARTVEALKELNGRARGDEASLELIATDLGERIDRCHADLTVIEEARGARIALADESARLSTLRAATQAERAAVAERAGTERATLERDRARCAEAHAGFDSLERAAMAAASRLESVERASTLLTQWQESRRRLADASSALLELQRELGLPADEESTRTLMADLLGTDEISERRAALEERAGRLRLIETLLASERLASALAEEEPDLEALAGAERTAEIASTEADRRVAAGEAGLAGLEESRDEVRTLLAAWRAADAEAGPIRRLAALATGAEENLMRTPLSSWVLMSRFNEVLAAANPRLDAISDGRYELRHTVEDHTRTRKSGLGLVLIDHDTDTQRSARTLSGGETFYVSLSLALGLADVVTAEAGGISLGTMFIDEGFGSLDSSRLDAVMGQLEHLRTGGRVVGVISHVEEMSRRINDQIIITKTDEGTSTLRLRGR